MPAPLLAAKLYLPPPRPGLVSRPHLITRLNDGLASGRKLTLLSAPAGFGKTTLVSEWIAALTPACCPWQSEALHGRAAGARAAWLSLDPSDSDPARFLAYFIAALQSTATGLGAGALAALQTPQPPPVEGLLTSLLNEITALPERRVLVLDDYHALDSQAVDVSTPVDQALAFLLDHLPPQLHLVITTRQDPSLPLARLRARSQLTELRAADLRFTSAEAAEFLIRAMGLNLSDGDVAALETRTEGWIAGLQLAALALQAPLAMPGQSDPARFIQSFTGSHRFVLDYLLEEVLQRQPPTTQGFLLRTAILERLCGPLCEAVLGQESLAGQETLEALERANLFLVPLDGERRWYRYHHLFGELLRQRLGDPPDLAELHLRASQWFEANGDLAAAFRHAHAANAFERAASLAELAWKGMNDTFQDAAWFGWVKQLPEAVICARPLLCTQAAAALTDTGELEASEARLQDAERALGHSPDPSLPARITLARAYNAQVQGKLAETIHFAELALQHIPADDVMQRAQAAILLEFTHWSSGDLEPALRAIGDWMESMTRLGNHVFVVASAFAVADLLVGLGRLGEAERANQDALQLAAQHGPEAEHITAHHHLGLSMLYHERGDDARAVDHLQQAAERGKQTTLVDWPHRWHVAQAQLKEAAGNLEAALALLDEAKRVYVKNPVPDLRPIAALKARIYLKQGRPDKARAWAAERRLSLADEASYLGEFELLTLARLEITNPAANALLERLLGAAEAQKRRGSALDILLTQALAYEAQGNHPQALAALARALSLAEPEGYSRIFVDEGEKMRLLMADFRFSIEKQAGHPLAEYVVKLLSAFAPPRAVSQSASSNQKSEILSERELEILRLVAQGLSNTEISQRLYLALSTVKGHNLRIFGKLQAQNRTEAVARARELGLI